MSSKKHYIGENIVWDQAHSRVVLTKEELDKEGGFNNIVKKYGSIMEYLKLRSDK